jgi:molecular chaperone GrpE
MTDNLPPDASENKAPETGAAPEPEAAAEDWEKRFTYLYADFENFRRRTDRERDYLRARTQAEVLKGVLPILEAAEKAVEAVRSRPPDDPVRTGVEMLERAIGTLLSEHGVRVVGRTGEPFRPEEHEAVGETTPTVGIAEGHVAEVVQLGYAFPGGLLRPAKVVVARRPSKPPAEDTTSVGEGPDGNELAP